MRQLSQVPLVLIQIMQKHTLHRHLLQYLIIWVTQNLATVYYFKTQDPSNDDATFKFDTKMFVDGEKSSQH